MPAYEGLIPEIPGAQAAYQYQYMSDVVGNRNGQNFMFSEKADTLAGIANGPMGAYDVNGWHYGVTLHHSDVLPDVGASDNVILSKAIAGSNPSRPVMNLPVSGFEMREIPDLLKSAGTRLSNIHVGQREVPPGSRWKPYVTYNGRDNASSYLEWQFGWAPLISDLGKISNFISTVQNRAGYIHRLIDRPGGVKGQDWSASSSPFWIGPIFPCSLYQSQPNVWMQFKTTVTKWASVAWTPDVDMSGINDDDVFTKAIRSAYNLNLDVRDLWSVLPWSWLVDWFTNVGDIVDGSRNCVGMSSGSYCIMTRTRTSMVTHDEYNVPTGAALGVRSPWLEWQNRILAASVSPEAYLPFLNGSQLSILTSLSVVRASR